MNAEQPAPVHREHRNIVFAADRLAQLLWVVVCVPEAFAQYLRFAHALDDKATVPFRNTHHDEPAFGIGEGGNRFPD
jgi:hypothetical protein